MVNIHKKVSPKFVYFKKMLYLCSEFGIVGKYHCDTLSKHTEKTVSAIAPILYGKGVGGDVGAANRQYVCGRACAGTGIGRRR